MKFCAHTILEAPMGRKREKNREEIKLPFPNLGVNILLTVPTYDMVPWKQECNRFISLYLCMMRSKLDEVGPADNRPFTK